MKKLLYVMMAALMVGFVSCKDDPYQIGVTPDNQEAYFPSQTVTVNCAEDATSFDVRVSRVKYTEAGTVGITATAPSGITVPATVSFNAGEETAKLTIAIDQAALEQGESYQVSLKIAEADATPYNNTACVCTVTTWAPEPPVTWVPVETECVLKEAILSCAFTNAGVSTYDVYVEKRSDRDIFRIVNMMTTYTDSEGKTYTHPHYVAGDEVSPDVSYFEIDCSGYYGEELGVTGIEAGKVWIPLQTLNIDWGYGEMISGSVAYNLGTADGTLTPADYAVGTYDAANGVITFGQIGLQLPTQGWFVTTATDPAAWATLYLDKSKMGTDFERDCTFEFFTDAQLNSELADNTWAVKMYKGTPSEDKAEEYAETFGTVYKVEDMYTEGFPIYFCEKDGEISVPEEYESQETGQSFAGFDLSINITGGTYADDIVTLELDMVGTDPAKVKDDVSFGAYTEILNAEVITTAESIDDFCGSFNMSGLTPVNPTAQTVEFTSFSGITVNIEKVDDTTVKMTGLLTAEDREATGLGDAYDDAIILTYEDGYLKVVVQDMPDVGTYDMFLTMFDAADPGTFYNKNAIDLIGMYVGINKKGELRFLNDAELNAANGISVNGLGIIGQQGTEYYLIHSMGWYVDIRLTPATDGASLTIEGRKEFVTKPTKVEKVVTSLEKRDDIRKIQPKQAAQPVAKATQSMKRTVKKSVRTNFVEL